MTDSVLRDKKLYELAKEYLPSRDIAGVTSTLIEKYLNPLSLNPKPHSKQGFYQRLLESAQNANMKAGVIGRAIGGVDKLSSILADFSAKVVLEKYTGGGQAILDEIVEKLKPRGEIRQTARSIWPQYCQTILSAANFIEQFSSASDFFEWVDFFDKDNRARAGLPMLLSQEIDGFGFALSCDFLKEMGYINFPKPDVHLRDIFTALGLCSEKQTDYQLFKVIVRVAWNAGVSPYNADKVFWLIGSGYFYDDPNVGKKGRIGSYKKEFIKYAKPLLEDMQSLTR
jgi:hypothetical protein